MKRDIVKRKIKISIIDLQKNDPEIMPDPSVKYFKNNKCDQINQLFFITVPSHAVHLSINTTVTSMKYRH